MTAAAKALKLPKFKIRSKIKNLEEREPHDLLSGSHPQTGAADRSIAPMLIMGTVVPYSRNAPARAAVRDYPRVVSGVIRTDL